MLQALAERRIGRRDQASRWIWRMAEYTREVHEEYAVQRWPETKRLLGPAGQLLRRRPRPQRAAASCTPPASRTAGCPAALLAAALAHTPEAQQALDGARMRMARKPSALARELLRNFPKGRRGRGRGRRRRSGGGGGGGGGDAAARATANGRPNGQRANGPAEDVLDEALAPEATGEPGAAGPAGNGHGENGAAKASTELEDEPDGCAKSCTRAGVTRDDA